MKRYILFFSMLWMTAMSAGASIVERTDNGLVLCPDEGQSKVVCLQVVNDRVVRVRATSAPQLPVKPKSLMVVPQSSVPKFNIVETDSTLSLLTAKMQVVACKKTGSLSFFDVTGKVLLKEAPDGKRFWPFRVPDREIGIDVGKVSEEQRHGLSWQMVFDSPADEAFYGLGQHQSEELNMKGKNEELFQYNTKVSVPFVISNKNYGLLWDSYSYCRFGQPDDYLQLNRAFTIYDKDGNRGGLTGTYTDKDGKTLVCREDSIYYEYDLPDKYKDGHSDIDNGGIKNLPKGFRLNGATVVYEGFLEPSEPDGGKRSGAVAAGAESLRQFILYYAGYVKVYIGGHLVVPERWRTAWNPNSYKFEANVPNGVKTPIRIEWKPDGDVSYCGLRVAKVRSREERGQLSVWSEMSQDMDYYFIAGSSMDEVISGYRTLTGKAPVYPKWVLGYWQSRERYKEEKEIIGTLAEFRRRGLPIDNIVQDWNYWPEDQWGSHLFETSRYPSPKAMLDSVHKMHGRFMISVWPKFYCSTDNYKELDSHGWMYHQAVVDDIHDWVGPGYVGSFYDAYNEGARKMFWRQMDEKLYTALDYGVDAWWMDASEPNVRDCTPMWYRKALCGPVGVISSDTISTSTEYFNAYSLVNADAIYNGQRSVNPNERVFLLTRSGFSGLQRYSAATWSGDIGTRWEDMRAQMTAGMNYSLSGLPYWGMDIGGFCVENRYMKAQQGDNDDEDLKEWRELQTRWLQFGTFVPLFRAHGQWPLREPWAIAGGDTQNPAYISFAFYDRLRYHLMPYLYSMAGWVHFNDYTMMRALVMDYGNDSKVLDIKDQWMFGPSLMACPVSQYKARSRKVYFPTTNSDAAPGGWYDLYTGRHIPAGQSLTVDAPYEQIPVYVPEGGIIPFGPAMEWCDEKPSELINLYVYAGRDSQFTLYEDEGTNYNYERGRYATISISYDDSKKTVSFADREGEFDGMLKDRRFNIVYITPEAPQPLNLDTPQGRMVHYKGEAITVGL